MKPKLSTNNGISAFCINCQAITGFDAKATVINNSRHTFKGDIFERSVYTLTQCVRCGRGGLATIGDNGGPQTAKLEEFFPVSVNFASIPTTVPSAIEAEFREAERCAAFGANRAASALFRSVLEKT